MDDGPASGSSAGSRWLSLAVSLLAGASVLSASARLDVHCPDQGLLLSAKRVLLFIAARLALFLALTLLLKDSSRINKQIGMFVCFVGEIMMRMTIQHILVDGRRVRYEVSGAGDPLVLVHGLSGSTLWWRKNVPTLSQYYRVYLVDLPGFGSMHFPRSRFVLQQAAAWLLRWMQALGLQKVHLIGHSMGGHISLWLAAHHPEVVSRLVLAAPAVIPRARNVLGYFVPLLAGTRYMAPGFFGILLYDALRAGPLTLLKAAHDLIAGDVQADMQHVQSPTLLVWGENDTLVPAVMAPVVRAAIPGSHLSILKGAGHVCMFDRADEFNTVVLTFLRGEDVGTTA